MCVGLDSIMEQTEVKFGLVPLFFPRSEHVAGSIMVGSGIKGRSSVPFWGAASLSASALELRSWYRYPPSPCRLQSAIWSRFSCCGLSGSSQYRRSSSSKGIAHLGVITRTWAKIWQQVSLIFLSGRTHTCKTKTCICITFVRCIRTCKRRDVI